MCALLKISVWKTPKLSDLLLNVQTALSPSGRFAGELIDLALTYFGTKPNLMISVLVSFIRVIVGC